VCVCVCVRARAYVKRVSACLLHVYLHDTEPEEVVSGEARGDL
jgi:hypothetical protein